MNKTNLTAIIAATAIASGCSINPKTPQGQFTQLTSGAEKAYDMKQKEKEVSENPFEYKLDDMASAYDAGCFDNYLSTSEIMRLDAKRYDSKNFAQGFVGMMDNIGSDFIDNGMHCYGTKIVKDEAEDWKYRSNITEPISATVWLYGIHNATSSNGSSGKGSGNTMGGGSQDLNGGSGINP